MFPADCPSWVECGEGRKNLTDSMLFRLLVASTAADCPALRVTGEVTVAGIEADVLGDLTPDIIVSAEAPGAQTLAGLYTAFTTWKTANPTLQLIKKIPVIGGDGISGIIVLTK